MTKPHGDSAEVFCRRCGRGDVPFYRVGWRDMGGRATGVGCGDGDGSTDDGDAGCAGATATIFLRGGSGTTFDD